MGQRGYLTCLILTMAIVVVISTSIAFQLLYRVSFEHQTRMLAEIAHTQTRLIESVVDLDVVAGQVRKGSAKGDHGAGLCMIRNAYLQLAHPGHDDLTELIIGKREGDNVLFLGSYNPDNDTPDRLPLDSPWSVPMRRALAGETGVMVAPDFRGEPALSAFRPVNGLDVGFVAQVSLSRIQAPFVQVGAISGGIALFFVVVGGGVIARLVTPWSWRLKESEALLRQITENIRDVFWVSEVSPEQTILYISPGYDKVFGRSRTSLERDPKSFTECIHPDDVARVSRSFELQASDGFDEVYRITRSDDDERWIHDRAFPIKDKEGEAYRIVRVATDVTALKRSEMRWGDVLVENRRLLQGLYRVQEEERRILAMELHDVMGQALTSISIDAAVISRWGGPMPKRVKDAANSIESMSKTVMGLVRDHLRELPPESLYQLGLVPSLQGQLNDWQRRTGIQWDLTATEGMNELDEGLALTIYRVVQEGLTNVAKHADARRVEVSLKRTAEDSLLPLVEVIVEDDGCGFEKTPGAGNGLGLLGMRERVRSMGGDFNVRSRLGKGTMIIVTLPLNGVHHDADGAGYASNNP